MTPEALEAEALRVRTELAALGGTLALVQQELGDDRISRLLAANEQLVRAALLADSIAENALQSLSQLNHGQPQAHGAGVRASSPRSAALELALTLARQRQTRLAVICIGVDAGSVAERGGGERSAQNALMQAAVRRLEARIRTADTICAEEGEAALLVLAEVARAGDAARVAIKLVAALTDPVAVDGRELQLSASLGVAIYPLDGADAATLLLQAEAAMQRARTEPGSGIEFAGVSRDPASERTSRLPRAPAAVEVPVQHLREVNERLVIAAVQAQQQQLDALERTRELQVRFLAMVAHELRNPLMPIRTAAELLLRARDDESMLTRLQGVIQRQVAQMSRLVDDLLDTSRITSGRMRLERGAVDLATVLETARDSCQAAIDSRLQRLEWSVTGPLATEGDAVRLAQVFSNLLDNASKYTPRGGRVALRATLEGDSILVSVSDDGRGISASAMPHLFDLFAQDPRTFAFGHGGFGVGLAVVRELVDAHGGTVVARSAGEEQGSEFVVTLPRSALAVAA